MEKSAGCSDDLYSKTHMTDEIRNQIGSTVRLFGN